MSTLTVRRFTWRALTVLLVACLIGSGLVPQARASAPVLLSGSAWLNGQGVNVCDGSTDPYCGSEGHVGGWSANWWQCVELAQRLYQKLNWHSGTFGVSYAYQIYDQAPAIGMTRQPNGSITSIKPGDMIIHGSDAPYSGGAGHVSVVDYVVGSTVHVVEQNTYNDQPRATYTLSGGTLTRSGSGTLRGIVHDPANTLGATPPANNMQPNNSDVDGNRGADLIITTAEAGGYFKSFALPSTYEQFLQPQLWLNGSGFGWSGITPLAGDVNGDGKSDYVFLTREASGFIKAFVSKSTGSGFQTPQLWWDGTGYGYDGIKAVLR